MKTTILTVDDIRLIVQKVGIHPLMDEMIDRLEKAFRDYDPQQIVIPIRSGFSYSSPQVGLIEWMPVMQTGSQVTVKLVGYHPLNPSINRLPTIISTVSAYDTCSGHLLGLADGNFLTALRTAAASAVASRAMAAENSRVVGMIGCGSQAVSQLHALSRRYDLEEVLVYDIDPHVSRSFIARTAFLEIKVTPVEKSSLDLLLRSADILCTCTSVEVGAGPVFEDSEMKPWLHINAIGSDFPGKFEVPLSVLKRSFVCPDFLEQASAEGECQRLQPDEIGATIVDVIQNPDSFRDLPNRSTVFDSTGWALEDHVALELLMAYAHELGVGMQVAIENFTEDPRDPYRFVKNGY